MVTPLLALLFACLIAATNGAYPPHSQVISCLDNTVRNTSDIHVHVCMTTSLVINNELVPSSDLLSNVLKENLDFNQRSLKCTQFSFQLPTVEYCWIHSSSDGVFSGRGQTDVTTRTRPGTTMVARQPGQQEI